jgi:hypothetical protein
MSITRLSVRRRLIAALVPVLASVMLAPAATVAQAGPPQAAGICPVPVPGEESECTEREPPPPLPTCDANNPHSLTDERPLEATSIVAATVIARATPHIRWCWDRRTGDLTAITMYGPLTVDLVDLMAYKWEYVGGVSTPFIDAFGIGHYVQSITVYTGIGIELNGKRYGVGTQCTMTIRRDYVPGVPANIRDDKGTCKGLLERRRVAAVMSERPTQIPAAWPYPQVEEIWIEPAPDPEPEPEDDNQIRILDDEGNVLDDSRWDDIIDSPCLCTPGTGDDDPVDPVWLAYFFEVAL